MREVIQNINDITDSRELLEAKPHPFMEVFIYSLVVMIIIAFVCCYVGEIDVVVKANGIVRPTGGISKINNKIMGKVEKIYYEDGEKVKNGQVLYVIEHNELSLEKNLLEKELGKSKQTLLNLRKFRVSVVDDKNYFNQDTNSEKEYYNKYIKYDTDFKKIIAELKNSDLDMEQVKQEKIINQKSLTEQIEKTQEIIKDMQLIKHSIEQNKNLLTVENGEFYNHYMDFILNVQKLENSVDYKKEQYECAVALYDIGAVSEQEKKDAYDTYYQADLDLQKYKNEYMLNLKSNLEKNIRSLDELRTNQNKTKLNFGIYENNKNYVQVALDKFKTDMIVQIEDSIEIKEKEVEQLEKDLNTVAVSINDCTTASPIDGTVNIVKEINRGDFLQSGEEISTIIPKSNINYKVQLYVLNKDIANIRIGDSIKYHFMALPYKEYGELLGRITKIGSDSKSEPNNPNSVYLVEAEIENKPLYSYKGVKAEIMVGMECEAHIITRTKKLLYYLWEKLSLGD